MLSIRLMSTQKSHAENFEDRERRKAGRDESGSFNFLEEKQSTVRNFHTVNVSIYINALQKKL